MIKRYLPLIAALLIMVAVTGCAGETAGAATGPQDSQMAEVQEILAKAVQAMGQVNTFSLDMNLTLSNNYTWFPVPNGVPLHDKSSVYWKTTRAVNIDARQLEISIDSDRSVLNPDGTTSHDPHNTWDEITTGGYNYIRVISPGGYEKGTPVSGWGKTEENVGTDFYMENDIQIPHLIELLNSPARILLTGNEKVSGVQCYVLDLNPAPTAVASWAISQHQPYTFFPASIPLNEPQPAQAYGNYLSGASVNLWISQDSFQILQANIDATFDVKRKISQDFPFGQGGIQLTTPSTEQDNEGSYESIDNFHGVMTFSDYNQPIDIKPPPEDEILASPTRPPTTLAVPDREISFKDPNLAVGIRKALNKPQGSAIYLSDTIKTGAAVLNLVGMNISDLSGLQNFSRTNVLQLSFNSVSDLSPLEHLPLGLLGLDHNQITDISPLATLSGLVELDLQDNRISDISPLLSISSLQTVNLENNPLSPDSLNKYIPELNARGVSVSY